MIRQYSTLLILLFSLLQPGHVFGLEASNENREGNKAVQFSGIVAPGKSYQINLQPSESVMDFPLAKGRRIAKGDLLITFANERLFSLQTESIKRKTDALRQTFELKRIRAVHRSLLEKKEYLAGILERMDQISATGIAFSANEKTMELKEKHLNLLHEITLIEEQTRLQEEILAVQSSLRDYNTLAEQAILEGIGQLKIYAAFSGQVSFVHLDPGRAVAGEKLLEIWDTSTTRIHADVPQNYIGYLKIGTEVKIFYDYFSDSYKPGTITEIGTGVSTKNSDRSGAVFPVIIQPKEEYNARIGHEVVVKIEPL